MDLAINLDHVMQIITRALNSLPTRIPHLLSIFTEDEHIIYQIITKGKELFVQTSTLHVLLHIDGKIINQIFGSMGELLLSTTVGNYQQNLTYIGISNKSPNGYTTNHYHYRPPPSSLTSQNVLINITFDTVGNIFHIHVIDHFMVMK